MFKKCKVVMLPTNEKANIILSNKGNKLVFDKSTVELGGYRKDCIFTPQHLYITSDEEIKEGDWFNCNQAAQQCVEVRKNSDYPYKIINKFNGEVQYQFKTWRGVIIATTDKLLTGNGLDSFSDKSDCLPSPSQSFIEKYIQSYNKGQQIVDVLVEYEQEGYIIHQDFPKSVSPRFYLKISKDNTITIKRVKDSWSREELISKLNTAISEAISYPEKFVTGICLDSTKTNNWIEQNL